MALQGFMATITVLMDSVDIPIFKDVVDAFKAVRSEDISAVFQILKALHQAHIHETANLPYRYSRKRDTGGLNKEGTSNSERTRK